MLGIFRCFVAIVAFNRPCEEDGFVSRDFHLYYPSSHLPILSSIIHCNKKEHKCAWFQRSRNNFIQFSSLPEQFPLEHVVDPSLPVTSLFAAAPPLRMAVEPESYPSTSTSHPCPCLQNLN